MNGQNTAQLAVVDTHQVAIERAPEMSVKDLVERVQKVQEVASQVMKEGHDYGKIPGVDKDVLFKPGAEILALTFRLDPQLEILERIWHEDGHLTVITKCTMFHGPSGTRMGSGLGACSTKESKYAWRRAERLCPRCQKPAIMKSKNKGEGFYCWAKREGCGAKFAENDKAITEQKTGRTANPDIADCYNTVLKMSAKRAQVAATLIVTCASRIFTQDQEDFQGDDESEPPRKPGSGAAAPGGITPHGAPDEDTNPIPETNEGNAFFLKVMARLQSLEEQTAKCVTYDDALLVRQVLGSNAKPSQLTGELSTAVQQRLISGAQHRDLGKIWKRIDRQLQKREKELGDAVNAFSDGDDGGGEGPGGEAESNP